MKYSRVHLSDILRIDRTVASKNESKSLPYVGLEHIEKNEGRFAAHFRPKPESLLATKFKFHPHHVLYGKLRPYLNKVVCPTFEGVCTTEILPLRAIPGRLDRDYLFALLLSQQFVRWASQSVSGANLPRLNPDRLLEFETQLPPLPEQKRIAGILTKADELRRMRRYALELSDTFLPAAFLELFGDPVNNAHQWPTDTLESVTIKITDGEHLNPEFVSIGLPIVMAEQVEDFGVNFDSCKLVSTKDFVKFTRKCEPKAGDLLIVSRGATIGRSCVVNTKKPFCLMGSVILVSPDSNVINPYFLVFHLKSEMFRRVLRKTSGSSAQQAIYIAHIKNNTVVVPPIFLQKRFAEMVTKHISIRATQQELLRQAEHLFQTLLHKAFNSNI